MKMARSRLPRAKVGTKSTSQLTTPLLHVSDQMQRLVGLLSQPVGYICLGLIDFAKYLCHCDMGPLLKETNCSVVHPYLSDHTHRTSL